MFKNETWSAWYESMVSTAYIAFLLWEFSDAFRSLLYRFWHWLKPLPRTRLNGLLAQELEEILREMNEWH